MHLVQNSVGSALGIHWSTALPNVPLIRGETLDLSHHQGNGIIPSGYWKSPLEDTPFGLAVLLLQQPLMQTTDCGQPNDCLHHALWLGTPSEAAPARSPPPFYTAMWAAEIRVWGCFCVRKKAFSFSLWPWTLIREHIPFNPLRGNPQPVEDDGKPPIISLRVGQDSTLKTFRKLKPPENLQDPGFLPL